MLYYQLKVTFQFEPYEERGKRVTEPQDHDIVWLNQRLQRAFASVQAHAFPEFAVCCHCEKDNAAFVLGLETMTERKALAIVEQFFGDLQNVSDVRRVELCEISSEQMLSGFMMPASDTGLLQDFPACFETWDSYCEPEEFLLDSCIGKPEALSMEDALAEAKTLMLGDTFLAEIRRIYAPVNARTFIEHPVHYRLALGNEERIEPVVGLLVRCLHSVGRLLSVRYDILKKLVWLPRTDDKLRQLFEPSAGATIVLATSQIAGDASAESSTATANETFDKLAGRIRQHHQKTLFIFIERHPHDAACDQIIRAVGEELRIVELGEGRRPLSQARSYLKQLIDASDLRAYFRPDDLNLPEQGGYAPADVQNAYAKWRTMVLRERVYPSYQRELADVAVAEEEHKTAWQKLRRMVGLAQAKAVLQDMVAAAKLQSLRKSWGIQGETVSRHMVFTGNPGSAKTTVARLTAGILAEEGVILQPRLVECGRADLVGKYVGWTAKLVKKRFREASGGVLFIDEAYALLDDHHSFGDEAINAIVQEMENHRDDVIVIFAGYPDKMKAFLERNEGLRSRIAFHVDFPDATPEELGEILELMCEERGYQLTAASRDKCADIFASAVKTPNFGNGRFVRNLLEQATLRQAKRLMETHEEISKEQGLLLLPEDFDALTFQTAEEKRIGFC